MSTHCYLTAIERFLFLSLLIAALFSPSTHAQQATPPSAQPSAAATTQSSSDQDKQGTPIASPSADCPGDAKSLESIYPKDLKTASGVASTLTRRLFSEAWQQDYPQIIFNARDGKLYWFEPGNDVYILVQPGFVPTTSIAEKVILRVCGLHFGSQVTTTPVSQAIPDGTPELYAGAVQGSGGPSSGAQLATPLTLSYRINHAPSGVCRITNSKADAIKKAAAEIVQLAEQFDKALAAYESSSEFTNLDAIYSGNLSVDQLDRDLAAAEKLGTEENAGNGDDTTLFNNMLKATRDAANETANLTTNFNAAMKGPHWQALLKAATQLDAAARAYAASVQDVPENCDIFKDATVQHAESDITNEPPKFNELGNEINGIIQDLKDSYDRLNGLYADLNDYYAASSITRLRLLDLPSGNSVSTVSISVSDPWVPIVLPAPPSIAESPNPAESDATTTAKQDTNTTVVSIDRSKAASTGITTVKITPSSESGNASASLPEAPSATIGVSTDASSEVTVNVSSVPPAKSKSATPPTSTSAPASTPAAPPDVTFLMERHHIVHFLATGGLLLQPRTSENYATETFQTLVATTTTTVTTPPSTSTTPPYTTITYATTTGTDTFAYRNDYQYLHPGAVVGLTWFPLGLDLFSTTSISKKGRFGTQAYYDHKGHELDKVGFFLGTTVNTLGTFVGAVAYEVAPGIEIYAGGSNLPSSKLTSGVVACSGPGAATIPNSVTLPTQTDSSGDMINETIATSTMTGCANSNATVISGTTAPTQPYLKFAPAVGILLNSNLFKALGLSQ